jgi:sec-independent protein translocase protein TatC
VSDDKKQIVPVDDAQAETPDVEDEKQLTTPPDPDPESPEEETDEKRMTFTEHLGELRIRIIRAGIALAITVLLTYVFSEFILKILTVPLNEINLHLFSPFEKIFLKIKIAGYGGLLITLPYILWQLCAFVFPGLRPIERNAIKILLFGCSILAVIGVLLAYFFVLPFVLTFLAGNLMENMVSTLNASKTLGNIIQILAGFAIAFQFPMVVLILVQLDFLTPETLKKYRKVSVVGMAVVAAMLTPPDPVTMTIMLLPLIFLYEGSILISYLVVRRKKRAAKDAE